MAATANINETSLRHELASLKNQNKFGAGWQDLIVPITSTKSAGVNQPTGTAFGPGSPTIYQFAFTNGDEVFGAIHIPHDIKPNTLMYPHVHWTTNGTSTAQVDWTFTYTVAKGHNQEAFPAETSITLSENASGIAWQHMVTEASDAQAFEAPEIDSLIAFRLHRSSATNTDTVFALALDLHYQSDGMLTTTKSPEFTKND